VLSFDLAELGRALPDGVRWEELGPLRGFFQGVLFDREVLAGSSQPDCSDAKLVLQAYAREGEAALSRLRGSFVVAIVDGARGRAMLVRDPMGSHPLFYAEAGSCVLFAVSPGRLLGRAGVSRELNRAAIADHLCQRWPDPHETFFKAVRRVPPGMRAVLSKGRLQFDRYWDPAPVGRPLQWLTPEEASGFDDVFERAVKRCLCHGRAGIFLSGGLDSISVAAVAAESARASGQSLPLALSLGFPDPECNEQERQVAVARDLGLRQILLDFDEALGFRPTLQETLELTAKAAAPILNAWQPAYSALARHARLEGADDSDRRGWRRVAHGVTLPCGRFDASRRALGVGGVLGHVAPIVSAQSVRTCSLRRVAMRAAATWRHGASPAFAGRSCCGTRETVFGRRSGLARPRS
jgi:hypothetical protein